MSTGGNEILDTSCICNGLYCTTRISRQVCFNAVPIILPHAVWALIHPAQNWLEQQDNVSCNTCREQLQDCVFFFFCCLISKKKNKEKHEFVYVYW